MIARGGLLWTVVLAIGLVVSARPAELSAEPARGRGPAARKSRTTGAGTARRSRPAPTRRTEPPREDRPASVAVAESSEAPPPATPRLGKPRVYTFGGLDVEGKLKAPQLLYFRSRMRQELDTSSSESRSFLKELEKTADEKGL
jgi:hypothetical protein